jgi:hypothetical protein
MARMLSAVDIELHEKDVKRKMSELPGFHLDKSHSGIPIPQLDVIGDDADAHLSRPGSLGALEGVQGEGPTVSPAPHPR